MFANIFRSQTLPTRVQRHSERQRLKALTNPVRRGIVDRLAALGPLSVRALASELGCKPTSIYRHLMALERIGLVRGSEVRGQRGRPATIYRTTTPVRQLLRAAHGRSNRAPIAKIADAMARKAAKDHAAAFKSKHAATEGSGRNHGFRELLAAPSSARLARINALMDELEQLVGAPDANPGRPIRITWFMSPTAGIAARRAAPPLRRRRRD